MGPLAKKIIHDFKQVGIVETGSKRTLSGNFMNSYKGLDDPEWEMDPNFVMISVKTQENPNGEYVILPQSIHDNLEQGQSYLWSLTTFFRSKDPYDMEVPKNIRETDKQYAGIRMHVCEQLPQPCGA